MVAVHVPHITCGGLMAFVSMRKTADGEPQQAAMSVMATDFYTKYVVIVDEDVNVNDVNDVLWAIATRVRAERDIFFIPGAKGAILDPTSDPETFTLTKMGIDATRPEWARFCGAAGGAGRTPAAGAGDIARGRYSDGVSDGEELAAVAGSARPRQLARRTDRPISLLSASLDLSASVSLDCICPKWPAAPERYVVQDSRTDMVRSKVSGIWAKAA